MILCGNVTRSKNILLVFPVPTTIPHLRIDYSLVALPSRTIINHYQLYEFPANEVVFKLSGDRRGLASCRSVRLGVSRDLKTLVSPLVPPSLRLFPHLPMKSALLSTPNPRSPFPCAQGLCHDITKVHKTRRWHHPRRCVTL